MIFPDRKKYNQQKKQRIRKKSERISDNVNNKSSGCLFY